MANNGMNPEAPMSTAPSGDPSSHSLFKHIFQSSAIYSIPNFAQPLISMAMVPIVTAHLRPGDYGVLGTLEQVANLLSLLLGGCFGSSIGYFYFGTHAREGRGRVVGTSILGAVFFGVVTTVICWVLGAQVSRLVFGQNVNVFYLRVMILGAVPSFATEVLLGWARVANRRRLTLVGALLRSSAGAVTVIILVLFFHLNILGMVSSGVVAVTIPALVLFPICWRATRPMFGGRLFLRMAKFYAPVGIGGLAVFCINFGDRLILWRYTPAAEIGLYVLAYKIGMLTILAYNSFNNYWSAQMFDIMKRDDAESLFARLLTYAIGLIAVPCLGLIVFAKPAIHLLAHRDFSGAAAYVPIIAIAYGIRCVGDFFRSRFLVAGHPGYDAVCNWVGAALCVAGYLYWIPRFGAWGAAFATVAAFVSVLAVAMIWTYRLRPYRVEGGRLVKVAIAMAAVLGAFEALPVASFLGQIAYGTLLVAVFPGLLWLLRFPTEPERNMLRAWIGRAMARIEPVR